jgi:dTDP-4-amino-4,6-dideoxy-D-galactose acyltransferase
MIDQRLQWKPLDWDTAFFGIQSARITVCRTNVAKLEDILSSVRSWGAQVVHFLIDSDHDESVRAAEQGGFHQVDIRMTLIWRDQPPTPQQPSEVIVRDHRDSDIPVLEEIARTSYHATRYYYDIRYPRERCDAMYGAWIVQSCRGNAARVIVAEQHGQPLGYVTCQVADDRTTGQIGLVGIHMCARGKGIGHALIQEAQRWFASQNIQSVSVVTQARNIEALRLYQRCGFLISQIQLWYHKWLEEDLDDAE